MAEEINAGMYLTPRITREQCREAIVGPARVCDIEIEEPLVNRMLNDLANFAPWEEKGVTDEENTPLDRLVRRADQLPLLQYALNRMWVLVHGRFPDRHVKLGLDDYKGLSYALDEHADQIFDQLNKENLPVEQVFRALTSGTSLADAVRQPTRFDRLVAICGGDEKAVAKVVDAYRAPGCNFLLPEVESQMNLGFDTLIDISHESLIRQWKRLSQWVAKEAIAAQQWRRLNDSFILGEPLHGRLLDNLVAWREETRPNAAWAKRYGGDYASVIEFLTNSERAEKRRLWIRNAAVAAVFLILLSTASVTFYLLRLAQENLAQAQRAQKSAESNYAIAKDVFRSLPFNFAGSLNSGSSNKVDEFEVTRLNDARRSAMQTLDNLVKANPNDVELFGIRVATLDKLLDGYIAMNGYHESALNLAKETNQFLRQLAEREPDSASWQAALSLNLGKIGDLQLRLHEAANARASYEEALAKDRALMMREPAHEDHPRHAAIMLIEIGDLQRSADKEQLGALKSYEEALDIQKKLAADYLILPVYQLDVSSTLHKISALMGDLGDVQGALEANQEQLNVDRKIAGSPLGGEADISFDLSARARLQKLSGDDAGALKSYQESLDTARREDDRHPYNVSLQTQIATTSEAIGDLRLGAGDIKGAKKSYESAFAAGNKAVQLAEIAYSIGETA
ncbi:MAG: hypothetical protein ACREC3_02480, partial [Methyloceanibacter sp.]